MGLFVRHFRVARSGVAALPHLPTFNTLEFHTFCGQKATIAAITAPQGVWPTWTLDSINCHRTN